MRIACCDKFGTGGNHVVVSVTQKSKVYEDDEVSLQNVSSIFCFRLDSNCSDSSPACEILAFAFLAYLRWCLGFMQFSQTTARSEKIHKIEREPCPHLFVPYRSIKESKREEGST